MAKREKQFVRSDNYYVVTGWMSAMLHLKGMERDVFAIIYGFSQTANQEFTGTQEYIAQWTGGTARAVRNCLDKLIEKGYIVKDYDGYNKPKYSAKSLDELTEICAVEDCGKRVENTVESVETSKNLSTDEEQNSDEEENSSGKKFLTMGKKVPHDEEKSSADEEKSSSTHYNIIYNINNNITDNINNAMQENASENLSTTPNVENVENKQDKTESKKYKYKNYQDIISEYTSDKKLQGRIWDFISMRKMTKRTLTNKALELVLKNLDSIASSKQEKILVLEQSVANAYADVYPLNKSREKAIREKQEQRTKDDWLDKYTALVEKYSNSY